MRVITGSAKGHSLKAPKTFATRPMLDRVKVSFFAVLEALGRIDGRVLDLYAGSGQLGIECLSRGATWADFVEQSAEVAKVIKANLAHTKLSERGKIHVQSVERYLRGCQRSTTYDIIVLDPPYADPQIETILALIGSSQLVQPGGYVAIGHSPRVPLADEYPNLARIKQRKIGDSCFSIYEQAETPEATS